MNNLKTVTDTVKSEYTKNPLQTFNDLMKVVSMGILNETIEEIDLKFVEREIKKSQINLGYVYNEDNAKTDILALKKAKKIPLESLKIQGVMVKFAEAHFTTLSIAERLFKLALGDSFPEKVSDGYKVGKTDESLRVQCPKYMLEVLQQNGSPEDFRTMIAERGYTSTNPAGQWGKAKQRVKPNFDLEINTLRTYQNMCKVLGADAFLKAFK